MELKHGRVSGLSGNKDATRAVLAIWICPSGIEPVRYRSHSEKDIIRGGPRTLERFLPLRFGVSTSSSSIFSLIFGMRPDRPGCGDATDALSSVTAKELHGGLVGGRYHRTRWTSRGLIGWGPIRLGYFYGKSNLRVANGIWMTLIIGRSMNLGKDPSPRPPRTSTVSRRLAQSLPAPPSPVLGCRADGDLFDIGLGILEFLVHGSGARTRSRGIGKRAVVPDTTSVAT
ncbi:hypothetical protein HD806DRAFT_530696 [Xylariaceae sp. AK1471]|nr:hypothetical protein HD806DRAFT_530696 [Xylariaceae sp. AK1471]